MRNVLCVGVLGADACDTRVTGFSSLAEGIVTAIEVFTFLSRGAIRPVLGSGFA